MKKNPLKSILNWYSLLVVSVFLCAFVIPVFPPSWGKAPLRIGFTLIFISGVMILEKQNRIILYLALAAFVMEWVSQIFDLIFINDISRFLNVLFFVFVFVSLIKKMATAKIVTTQVILSSISGYLLLGIIYSVFIAAIIDRDPASFNISREVNGTGGAINYLSDSMYFGFVTLASLGYGDILPLKPFTRSLATLITISGQLYIATIIGLLIGKFASLNDSKKDENLHHPAQ
jgi:voltage-gated potassium channel